MRKTNLACLVAGLFTLLGLLNVSAQASEWRVKAAFELGYADLQEVSGITQSRRFDNVYWVHNDSGDSARIFAIDGSGAIVFPPFLKVHGQNAVPGKSLGKGTRLSWQRITTGKTLRQMVIGCISLTRVIMEMHAEIWASTKLLTSTPARSKRPEPSTICQSSIRTRPGFQRNVGTSTPKRYFLIKINCI